MNDEVQRIQLIIILFTISAISVIINIFAINKKENEVKIRVISDDEMVGLEKYFYTSAGIKSMINFFNNNSDIVKYISYQTDFQLLDENNKPMITIDSGDRIVKNQQNPGINFKFFKPS